MTYTAISACRSCGFGGLQPILDLGEQPLANAFRLLADPAPEQSFPLVVLLCSACALVQLAGTVPPQSIFDDYAYFSSYSSTMVAAMEELAGRVTRDLGLGPHDLVVDIASNDGYLLRRYLTRGPRVLGVEPARNVADVAIAAGVPTLVDYFGTETAEAVQRLHGPARVIHANNVMAHVPEINDFVAGLALLLSDDGRAYVESPYLGRFVADCEFDTVYHEHVFYYSLTALQNLVGRHGLVVADVEQLPIHGGTLRCTLAHRGVRPSAEVEVLRVQEDLAGVSDPAYYADMPARVADLRTRTRELVLGLKAQGASIAAYGAAAKGTVMLNHFGIGADLVDVVFDRNTRKQGRLVPGVGIRVADPGELDAVRTSHLLVLVWNLLDEVLEQEKAFQDGGGKVVVALPEPRILEGRR